MKQLNKESTSKTAGEFAKFTNFYFALSDCNHDGTELEFFERIVMAYLDRAKRRKLPKESTAQKNKFVA